VSLCQGGGDCQNQQAGNPQKIQEGSHNLSVRVLFDLVARGSCHPVFCTTVPVFLLGARKNDVNCNYLEQNEFAGLGSSVVIFHKSHAPREMGLLPHWDW
jgi:hypothetical protein